MHSLKDVPGNEETPGLIIAATLPRDAANDALVLRPGLSLDAFRASKGKGFKIGTNAVRRAAYLRRLFPEVTVIHFRGAADTRVAKLDRGDSSGFPMAVRWGLRMRLSWRGRGWSGRDGGHVSSMTFQFAKCCRGRQGNCSRSNASRRIG